MSRLGIHCVETQSLVYESFCTFNFFIIFEAKFSIYDVHLILLSVACYKLYEKHGFIALIHAIQWTIAYPVGADRPAKHQ